MSHFVFGRVFRAESNGNRCLDSTSLDKASCNTSLFIRFDESIRQNVVREMLSERNAEGPGSVLCDFLITSGEGEDTSDSIVSPYCVGEAKLLENLSKIEQWTTDLLRSSQVARIDVYFSEGYDESFKTMDAVGAGWGRRIAEAIYKEGYVDSIVIQVCRWKDGD